MNSNKTIRIVILGAAGFIGYHLASKFVSNKAYKLVLVDNFINSRQDKELSELLNFENIIFKNLDLTIESNYKDLFEPGDIVLNCAAINGTQNFYSKPTQVVKNTAISAIIAAEYASKIKVELYVYFGSSESYAGGLSLDLISLPTSEEVPLVIPDVRNVRWSYAASKTLGEIATIANAKQYGLNFLILRLHNVYGPRMGIHHVIPDLISKFRASDGSVYGLDETRSFMYIDDFIEAVSLIIFNPFVVKNCTYNVGSENETTIAVLAEMIKQEMKSDVEICSAGSFLGSAKRRCPDTSRLRSQVKFRETSLVIGISKTVNWYLSND